MEANAEHWIVAVARTARLDRASELRIPQGASVGAAWAEVLRVTGISAERLTQYVADHHELEVADLEAAAPEATRILPSWVARESEVVPLRASDTTLVVATADPHDRAVLERVGRVSGRSSRFEVAPPARIAEALERAYPTALESEPAPKEPATRTKRALVVDDEEDVRLLLRTILESQGFQVDEAGDGVIALEMISSGRARYDLMTLDLFMENMHGLDVLKHVRAHVPTASLSVLVTTGTDDPAIQMKLLDAGADDFIVKPVDPPRFLLRVQAVLRRRARGRPGLI